jgi:membrane protein
VSLLGRFRDLPGWVGARLEAVRSSLPYRAYSRYSAVRGNVLAGGVAYLAFFSIFPTLALGFTVFALVLGNREDLQVQIVRYINSSLGAPVISYHQGQQGIVTIEQLVQPDTLTVTGIISLLTLVLSGLGWIAALRDGVQAVFGAREEQNAVIVKLLDLVLLAAAGLTVLASVAVSVAFSIASGRVLEVLGMTHGPVAEWTANVLGQLVLLVVDAGIFTLLFARLDGVDVPVRDLAGGAVLGAIGFSLLKLFGTELVRLTSHNRFLAASSLLVGLLVWMNLVARLLLVAAAWSATVAADRGHLPTPAGAAPVGAAAGDPSGPPPAPKAHPAPRARRAARLLLAGFLAGALAERFVTRRPRQSPPSAGAAPRGGPFSRSARRILRPTSSPGARRSPALGSAPARPLAAGPSHREPPHEGAAGHGDDQRGDQVDGP